jgi:lipopolysaccharide biosynthesis glycosyltransferase
MTLFSSDQSFFNHAYPERLNRTINRQLAAGDYSSLEENNNGQIVPLPWEYNAQTHVEVRFKEYWRAHRNKTKILHFTERKGWQCQKRHRPLNPKRYQRASLCVSSRDKHPLCNCIEGHWWWNALAKAEAMIGNHSSELVVVEE